MTDGQMELIRQIVSEQLNDYLTADLAKVITDGIMEGIYANVTLIEEQGQE